MRKYLFFIGLLAAVLLAVNLIIKTPDKTTVDLPAQTNSFDYCCLKDVSVCYTAGDEIIEVACDGNEISVLLWGGLTIEEIPMIVHKSRCPNCTAKTIKFIHKEY